jgi:anthranilate/para-aminobenzoate synthase component I
MSQKLTGYWVMLPPKVGRASFQASGGAVVESVPSLEHEETHDKAGAMVRALKVTLSRELWL